MAAQHIPALLDAVQQLTEGSAKNLDSFLASANQFLGTSFGIISRIQEEEYTILHVTAPPGTLEEGSVYPLGSTYCMETLHANDVLAITHATGSDFDGHPCHTNFGLECYIGVPLMVSGERFGTLNFSDPDVRKTTWSEEEKNLIRLMGRSVESHLANLKLQERLTENFLDLELTNDKLRSFASHASHDLRGPIKQIQRLATYIANDVTDPKEADRYLNMIAQKCVQMDGLITDLITYAKQDRHEQGRLTSVQTLISNVLDTLDMSGPVRVHVDLQDGHLQVLEGGLRSILYNLVTNAIIHHNSPETGHVYLTTHHDKAENTLVILVEDDGAGIPEKFRDLIFEPFGKLSTKGFGLGLSIATKIANEQGGHLSLEEGTRSGACFKLVWPLIQDESEPA